MAGSAGTCRRLPRAASLIGGAAPAISDRSVIFPFGSGELVSALRDPVSGSGHKRCRCASWCAYNSLSDITGDPVIRGNTLYAGTNQAVSWRFEVSSGERIWTATEGSYSPML